MESEQACVDGSEHDAEGVEQGDGTTYFLCVRCRFEWHEEDAS